MIYGWRVQEIRELVASSFIWRQTNRNVVEMVEVNRKRVNIENKNNCEELVIENASKSTELKTKFCFQSNDKADEKHGVTSRLQVEPQISPTDDGETAKLNHNIGDDAASDSDFETNERLSEGKKIKREENETTVTAIVHFKNV